ncbi:MAG: hypothetical protein DRH90_13585 [Deltaproteobacteria bacterium]|nr:MAG: hypothetical protein DRH90_13585 [Deltaproteobacteria bacterium]RLC16629.1 MAG: hypothetical protein DRI24_07895 [Deltaproteobacteria bacterium]
MSRTRTLLITIIVFSTILGLMALMGCGPSKEKQQMSGFLSEYNQAVKTYTELSKKADTNGISEMKTKVDSFMSRWSDLKMEMASEITPQDLNQLDDEFKMITKKYQAISAAT